MLRVSRALSAPRAWAFGLRLSSFAPRARVLLPSLRARMRKMLLAFAVGGGLAFATAATGCAHQPPVHAWQREHLARRSMQLDDGLEGRFRQHMFGAREGVDGGYGHVGGGCGCN